MYIENTEVRDEQIYITSCKSKDKVLSSKIGAALLKHLAKYPDVLAEDAPQINHSLDIPQREDL